jgi:DNA repair protein RadC
MRLRARFLEAGAQALADYELLELVLFRAIPRRDVKPLAKSLLARFGSFAEAICASRERLQEVSGLGEAAIAELKIVQAAAGRLARDQVRERHVLSSWSSVLDYCRTVMAYAEREELRVLFLDKRNHLIADERQQVGTVDHTPVYPRDARALRHRRDPRAQSSLRRSNALARRHPDDAGHHRRGRAARHRRARPHHRRQGRPCEPEGAEADLMARACALRGTWT